MLVLPYFKSSQYGVLTDYKALKSLLPTSNESENPTQWILGLSELELDIFYCDGRTHQAADAMPGLPTGGRDKKKRTKRLQY